VYAVIATGGKQYRVASGDVIRVEKIIAEEGAEIDFSKVLLIGDGDSITVGTPHIEGSKVTGTVRGQGRGKKVEIIKFRRRKQHRKQMGHRQAYTEVEITSINS
jgi:large subunit ribosomal protein L21